MRGLLAGLGGGPQDAFGGRDAADPGHPDVHEDHVGTVFGGQPDRLLAVRRLADHLDVGRGPQQGGHAGPDEDLVIGHQHPDHALSSLSAAVPSPPRDGRAG